jgi:hypothetical protein
MCIYRDDYKKQSIHMIVLFSTNSRQIIGIFEVFALEAHEIIHMWKIQNCHEV